MKIAIKPLTKTKPTVKLVGLVHLGKSYLVDENPNVADPTFEPWYLFEMECSTTIRIITDGSKYYRVDTSTLNDLNQVKYIEDERYDSGIPQFVIDHMGSMIASLE